MSTEAVKDAQGEECVLWYAEDLDKGLLLVTCVLMLHVEYLWVDLVLTMASVINRSSHHKRTLGTVRE